MSSDVALRADSHHAEGFACRKRGDYEAAITDYGQALKIDPRHFKAVYNRGFSFDKVRVRRVERSPSACMSRPVTVAVRTWVPGAITAGYVQGGSRGLHDSGIAGPRERQCLLQPWLQSGQGVQRVVTSVIECRVFDALSIPWGFVVSDGAHR